MRKLTTILLAGITALTFTACGGGGSSSDGGSTSGGGTNPPPATINEGGTPSSPTPISFDLPNKVDSNTHYNYYKYTGVTGDELIVHVELDSGLTSAEKERCGTRAWYADIANTFLVISDPNGKFIDASNSYSIEKDVCRTDTIYTLLEDGEHTIHFNYPNGHTGEAFVDKI